MTRIILASTMLSVAFAAGWLFDIVRYHEPAALQPLSPAAFETARSNPQALDGVADSLHADLPR
jgi:hypothetical protein